jgi:LacI family transcriptional regulator
VLPEVADSFFSLAINGIESAAQEKGYHVLIYLTHESLAKEVAILKDFQSGRVDGVLISVSSETENTLHIQRLFEAGMPIVFFDRVCEDIDTAKITTDDFEGGYNATRHLASQGCKNIALLSISSCLSICQSRQQGYEKALQDYSLKSTKDNILCLSNNEELNFATIKKRLSKRDRPDGIVATVEKLITPIYLACMELNLPIPGKVKVIGFSNQSTAPILNPALTTITQPAFEMGKAAATILFKALEKSSFSLKKEHLVVPSVLIKRESTAAELNN